MSEIHLSGSDHREIVEMYHTFHEHGRRSFFSPFTIQYFPKSDLCKVYPIENLEINVSMDKIRRVYHETGVIQLREVDSHADTLMIGCGNRPLSDSGGYPIDPIDDPTYHENHAHTGAITVDPDLAKNPTIVVFFGDQSLSALLKSHQFKKIIIEGVALMEEDGLPLAPYTYSEIDRLLSDDGKLYCPPTEENDFPVRERIDLIPLFSEAIRAPYDPIKEDQQAKGMLTHSEPYRFPGFENKKPHKDTCIAL